jgi:RNA polymerase sigma-70 factor (ECF subfamily)
MSNSRDDQFIERYLECQSGLYRFIATLVPNRADAEELFQEASLTAWKIRDRFDCQREMSPWLCGIARNLVAAHYRKQTSLAVTLDPDVVEQLGQQQMDEDMVLRERARALNQCLEKLPGRQRDLVRTFYHCDQTVQSFAQAQGLSVEAVYKMMQRVRMTLFECINHTLKRGELA